MMAALQKGTNMAQLLEILPRNAAADGRLKATVFGRRGADICQRRKQRVKFEKARPNAHELQDRVMARILTILNARTR